MKSIAIIPVYNEEKNIDSVVAKLRKYIGNILIVNDGSADDTLNRLMDIENIIILSNIKNRGKGHAIRKGLQYALKNKYDLAILMDGDGQHSPAEISKFISKSKDYDLVVGNRMHNHSTMPFVRSFVNKLDSLIVSKIVNFDIKDVHCGYRAVKTNLVKKLNLKSDRYEIEAEIIINAVKNKAKVTDLNIGCIYLGKRSSINPITDTLRFIRLILKNIQK